jgi:hypothetical protein
MFYYITLQRNIIIIVIVIKVIKIYPCGAIVWGFDNIAFPLHLFSGPEFATDHNNEITLHKPINIMCDANKLTFAASQNCTNL